MRVAFPKILFILGSSHLSEAYQLNSDTTLQATPEKSVHQTLPYSSSSFFVPFPTSKATVMCDAAEWPFDFRRHCWSDDLLGPNNTRRQTDECVLFDKLFSLRMYHPVLEQRRVENQTSSGMTTTNRQFSPKQASFFINRKSDGLSMAVVGVLGLSVVALASAVVAVVGSISSDEAKSAVRKAFHYFDHLKFALNITSQGIENHVAEFQFLEGLRALSAFWVILGHVFLFWFGYMPFDQATVLMLRVLDKLSNYLIPAAVFAVDTFFFMSGFLLGYHKLCYLKGIVEGRLLLSAKDDPSTHLSDSFSFRHIRSFVEFSRVGFLIILRRYFRLMGFGAVIFFGYFALNTGCMRIPAGQRLDEGARQACYQYWPSVIFLYHNLYDGLFINECFGWTWYLANDFQYSIIGVMLLFVYLCNNIVFWFLLGAILVLSTWKTILVANAFNLSVSAKLLGTSWLSAADKLNYQNILPLHPYMDCFYVKPWARAGPYIFGFATGIILQECCIRGISVKDTLEDTHDKNNKFVNNSSSSTRSGLDIVIREHSCHLTTAKNGKRAARQLSTSTVASAADFASNELASSEFDTTNGRELRLLSRNNTVTFDSNCLPNFVRQCVHNPASLTYMATGILVLLSCCAYAANRSSFWSQTHDNLFLGTSRCFWGLCLSCVVLKSVFGNGSKSFLCTFLSNKLWTILSRLSYSAYLSHPLIILYLAGNGIKPSTFVEVDLWKYFFFIASLTIVAGVTLSTLIEQPLRHLLRAAFLSAGFQYRKQF